MIRRLSKISLLLLSSWLLVGPMALLQMGAWGWMVASYSQESSFQQAIVETFGDERPCDMCLVIDAVEETEKGSPIAASTQNEIKLMLGLARPLDVSAPHAPFEHLRTILCEPENAHFAVPTPPPRAA